ncbi:hypothetical protein PHJA_001893600 [Phtheirospermum japonicum]|uniref:Uncharacterized protein n=1 Tax=Phtheirospermum japonicum TaxID=374723 RepID=A0A830CR44_9LAMI|nr:hypothetical protein PHJA_001893600 [Phtheirospermum japonicum]
MGVSEKLHQTVGGHVVDSEKWVFSGIALRGPLKPILTKKPLEKGEEEDECNFSATTPTSSESRIPSRLICPPAPKKRKSSASSKSCRVIEFFNPPDLETIFVRRVEARSFI